MKRHHCFTGILAASVLAVATGCGGSVSSTGAAGNGGGAGTAGAGGTAGNGGAAGAGGAPACPDFQGQASPGEIAKSPFASAEAELLALEASGKLVAPEPVYQRITLDLSAIRGTNAQLQNISAMPSWVPEELVLGFDDAGFAAVKAGTYTDWDCPNAYYGFMEKEELGALSFATLRFSHRYNAPLLAKDYAGLPHVTSAEPNNTGGDGNDLCVSIEGDTTYHYIFDEGSGDCPAGCIEHTYWGFTTKASQVITPLGTFTKSQGNPPSWFTALPDCTKWL